MRPSGTPPPHSARLTPAARGNPNQHMSGPIRLQAPNKVFLITLVQFATRPMSAGPRHHSPKVWARDRGDAVRWAVMTLAQAFRGEGHRPDWREASRQGPRDGDQTGGANQDGSPARCQGDPPPDRTSRAIGGRASSTKNSQATGSRPRAEPRRLEEFPDAAERPSRRGDQGAPLALARVVG